MTGTIALTAGDPAGIGPELLVRLLLERRAEGDLDVAVVSSRDELAAGLRDSGSDLSVDQLLAAPGIALHEVDADRAPAVGRPSAESGRWALAALERALELHAEGVVGGLCFGPLNKTSLHLAGMSEPDEMRWFESRIGGAATASEINVNQAFWTSRVTSHVALRQVPDLVTPDSVFAATALLHDLLVASGLRSPRIAVCALNPHAGEHGLFGDDEAVAIAPGVQLARDRGIDASGPFPCDTLFLRGFDGDVDGIVTMYHDQGQIALKTRSFAGGVTLEAGLGMPVCTPAHGTAFDLVGTGRADAASTRNAFDLARRLTDS